MNDLFKFLKKTWWLFFLLFIAPIIVVSVFAVLEFLLNRIDMSSGEWATLLGSAFGYWGTVILGTLAFWQNDKIQENNDILIQYERRKMSPVFSLYFIESEAMFSKISLNIVNCSDNIACDMEISNLSIERIKSDGFIESIGNYSIMKQEKGIFLGARENMTVIFDTPKIQLDKMEYLRCKINIFSTDIIGLSKKTTVTISINNNLKCNYKYEINDR